MKRLVRVSLNGKERRLAVGMSVRHLLTEEEVLKVECGELVVVDSRGRERGLDGALLEGSRLFLKTKP